MVKPKSNSWYMRLAQNDPLSQGDFLNQLPIIQPVGDLITQDEEIRVVIVPHDVVILSQSCDLEHPNKIDQVQVAPVFTLKEFLKKNKHLNNVESLEQLRKNQRPRYYLMNVNKSTLFSKKGYLIADLGAVRSVKYRTIVKFKDTAGDRITLKSPYKEQLSQHFARFYMRVGLPNDLKPFAKPMKV